MNKLLNDLIPKVLNENNKPIDKAQIIYLLNNKQWFKIDRTSILVDLAEFYQRLKMYYLGKACLVKVNWETTNKISNLKNYNLKNLFRLINNQNIYLGYVISVCFKFHSDVKRYNYDLYNRHILNTALIDAYKYEPEPEPEPN